jgi:hypothetical protein
MNALMTLYYWLSAKVAVVAAPGGDDSVTLDLWKVVAVLIIIALIIWIFFTVRRRR